MSVHSPCHKECPACSRQPQAKRAMVCSADWPDPESEIPLLNVLYCGAEVRPLAKNKLDSWRLAPPAPSPPVPDPTPRRQAQALARVERRRQRHKGIRP